MNWEHIPRNGLTLRDRLLGNGTKVLNLGVLSDLEVILASELQVQLLLDDVGGSREGWGFG